MIDSHIVVVPKNVISRDHVLPEILKPFEELTGIRKTRRFEGTAQFFLLNALKAAREHIDLTDVHNVVVVTQSPYRLSPCIAMDVHQFYKMPSHVTCFDVNRSCDGFIHGIRLAAELNNNKAIKTLLICYDMLRFNQSPAESLIFSDAVYIGVISNGWIETHNYNDASHTEKLYCGMSGEMNMDGGYVFDAATKAVPRLINDFMNSDIVKRKPTVLCLHQANLSMMKLIEKRCGHKFQGGQIFSIEEYGNQSMVSIPTALALNNDKVFGRKVLCVGYGAGFSVTAMGIDWEPKTLPKILEV